MHTSFFLLELFATQGPFQSNAMRGGQQSRERLEGPPQVTALQNARTAPYHWGRVRPQLALVASRRHTRHVRHCCPHHPFHVAPLSATHTRTLPRIHHARIMLAVYSTSARHTSRTIVYEYCCFSTRAARDCAHARSLRTAYIQAAGYEAVGQFCPTLGLDSLLGCLERQAEPPARERAVASV